MDSRDWLIITSIPRSLDIAKIAERSGLPQSTVSRRLKALLPQIKVRFTVSRRALGLKPLILIFDKMPYKLPAYTISYRKGVYYGNEVYVVVASVPKDAISDYISLFPYEPGFIFVGEERVFWRPDLASHYNIIDENLEVNYHKLRRIDTIWNNAQPTTIDTYDLLIIFFKEKYAFTSLAHISRQGLMNGIKSSQQLLSYHFHRHVLPIWLGNSVHLYRPLSEYPIRIHFYEVFDAENLVSKLSLIPYIHTIYYTNDSIAFSCQLSVKETYKLFKNVLVEYRAKPLHPEIYLDQSLRKYLIKYYKLWKRGWLKPSALVYKKTQVPSSQHSKHHGPKWPIDV